MERSRLRGQPVDELAPEGAVVRPREELGASPVRRAVGRERGDTTGTRASEYEEGDVAHREHHGGVRLGADAVVSEEVRPSADDSAQYLVVCHDVGVDALRCLDAVVTLEQLDRE